MSYKVYKITNLVNGKLYIGVSSRDDLRERWNEHVCAASKDSTSILHKSIKKYGKNNFKMEVIDTAETIEMLFTLETKHIKEHNSYFKNGNGYNMTLGGEGRIGSIITEETKQKLSISGKAFYQTPEGKESKKRAAKKLKGRYVSEEERLKKIEVVPNKRIFTIQSPTGEIITYSGITTFCRNNNLIRKSIRRVLAGTQKYHRGWKLPTVVF